MPRGSEAAGAGSTYRVERAACEDAAALAALAAEALPHAWSRRAFEEEIASEAARVWVVRGPGRELLGYLAAQHVLDEIHVLSLAVAAGARRRGLGRLLLEHALTRAGGARVAHLEVRSDDAGARAFYARLGFLPVGRRRGFYEGGIDAIQMSAALPISP